MEFHVHAKFDGLFKRRDQNDLIWSLKRSLWLLHEYWSYGGKDKSRNTSQYFTTLAQMKESVGLG